MASAPQPQLPLFYNDLMPLNSRDHGTWKARSVDKATWVGTQHAIPLTVDEFAQAQRYFPIVFSSGDSSVPLALLGLNEGVNVYFDSDGQLAEDVYVPAYIRRYPMLLAKLTPNAEEMSLCFDPSAELMGDFEEGHALFVDGQPSDHTKGLLDFCQKFEEAGARTQAFMEELAKADLLMDGEVAIQQGDKPDQPFIYRGFKMVNQEKLRTLDGEKLKQWNEIGLLPLVFAHLFSLDLMRIIFAKQVQQGKGPGAAN
ncbi:SapC family protein [Altererythrobacter sp. Root672]|uniref:SapC family protein n=1 Tax=Altererythrobacter sp. Root672 TaxID=1736584 RepID=UPI0006F28601|nr:SapC family protein [Altererythrobacter sp. Root672]KRA83067.1 multidrug transporter [Altererythrobacter sp. Root672]